MRAVSNYCRGEFKRKLLIFLADSGAQKTDGNDETVAVSSEKAAEAAIIESDTIGSQNNGVNADAVSKGDDSLIATEDTNISTTNNNTAIDDIGTNDITTPETKDTDETRTDGNKLPVQNDTGMGDQPSDITTEQPGEHGKADGGEITKT